MGSIRSAMCVSVRQYGLRTIDDPAQRGVAHAALATVSFKGRTAP